VQVAGCGGRINFYLFSIPFPKLPITNYQSPIPVGVAIFLPENDEKAKSYIGSWYCLYQRWS